jgi:hypothetical protein
MLASPGTYYVRFSDSCPGALTLEMKPPWNSEGVTRMVVDEGDDDDEGFENRITMLMIVIVITLTKMWW